MRSGSVSLLIDELDNTLPCVSNLVLDKPFSSLLLKVRFSKEFEGLLNKRFDSGRRSTVSSHNDS
ncbi:hypothetical protein [Bacillus sp. OK048]|uniref:hypothetical protein n=1 Tax=Bacillus sp. OK048 TaxID=1882761 RepID=UPI001113A9D7|nr:hypothetical protein [Bacillus sp. OK048]